MEFNPQICPGLYQKKISVKKYEIVLITGCPIALGKPVPYWQTGASTG